MPTMPDMPLRSAERPRRSRGAVWLALLLLVAAATYMAVKQQPQQNGGPSRSALAQDAGRLWEWTDPLLAGGAAGAAWSLRWEGRMTAAEADRLAELMDLQRQQEAGQAPEAAAYRDSGDGDTVLWLQEGNAEAAERVTAVLLITGIRERDGTALADRIAAVEDALGQAADGRAFSGSLSVRGTAAGEPGEALQRLERAAEAKPVERYDDAGTVSVSYEVPALLSSAQSGGRTVNLQAAVHRNTESGTADFAAGVPLITGDYTTE